RTPRRGLTGIPATARPRSILRPRSGRVLPRTGRGRPRGSSGAAPTGSFHSQRGRLRTGPVPGTSPRGLGRYTPSFLPGTAPTRRKIHKHGHLTARSGTRISRAHGCTDAGGIASKVPAPPGAGQGQVEH